MKTVVKLNIDNPEHAGFMFDLAFACQDDFLNDVDNDIILMMNEYQRGIKEGRVHAFIAQEEGRNLGIVWIEVDRYGVGRLRAGMMPDERKGTRAFYFLHQFIDHCFNTLKIRKLDAEFALYDPDNRSAKAAEKLLRRFGFKKEGHIKQALSKGGVLKDTILLGLTRDRYKGLRKHEQKEKLVRQKQAASSAAA